MSLQSVVPITLNGEQFFTHTSWLSQKQYNAWFHIPNENRNLAFYYGLTTIGTAAILFRRSSIVTSIFSSLSKTVIGISGSFLGAYLGWFGLLKSQQSGQIRRVVLKNECGSTPLWKSAEKVVNLRETNYKTFMSRRQGLKYTVNDIKSYNPENVLVGSQQNFKIQEVS